MSSASCVAVAAAVSERPPSGAVLCMSWNSDASCLAVGTDMGFVIYSAERTEPTANSFVELTRRTVAGGVVHIALHEQSNVVLLGLRDGRHDNVACVWDDSRAAGWTAAAVDPALSFAGAAVAAADDGTPANASVASAAGVSVVSSDAAVAAAAAASRPRDSLRDRCVAASVALATPIRAMRLHPRCILLAEESSVHLFDSQMRLVSTFATPGQLSLAGQGERAVDITPNCIALSVLDVPHASQAPVRGLVIGATTGTVRVLSFFPHTRAGPTLQKPTVLTPHTRPVRCIALSRDGTVGATISENGTAIKIIDMVNATVKQQLNRGTTPNAVHSMAISADASVLACLSETGTIHVFALSPFSGAALNTANPRSRAAPLTSALNYVPTAIAGNRMVTNAAQFVASESAFAVFSLGLMSAGGTIVDDLEAESGDQFSNAAAVLALRPGFVGVRGVSHMHVAQCGLPEASNGDPRGVPEARGRFLRLAIDVQQKPAQCTRVSTHLFPREEL